ncbi:MAG: hypothetical protein WBY22_12785 [Nitrososphaeraceae archaeon]|jgi:hypothetical protein
MLNPNLIVTTTIATVAILLLSSSCILQNVAFAHQRQLFTIGDKDYLFVVGSLGEPLYIDQKSGVDFSAFWPDPSDPVDSRANGSKPIEGLENMLKVEVVAGDKNKTFDFEPAFMNPGHYEAPFFPTVETTYNYTLFGVINGTNFRATWTCSPAGGEGTLISNNSTVEISPNVTRKSMMGSFGCPQPLSEAGFPEPMMSNQEIVKKLAEIGNVTKVQ